MWVVSQKITVAVADVQLRCSRLFGVFIQQTYQYFRRYSDASWLRYLVRLCHFWHAQKPNLTTRVTVLNQVIATMWVSWSVVIANNLTHAACKRSTWLWYTCTLGMSAMTVPDDYSRRLATTRYYYFVDNFGNPLVFLHGVWYVKLYTKLHASSLWLTCAHQVHKCMYSLRDVHFAVLITCIWPDIPYLRCE